MRLVIVTPFLESKGGMERVVLKIAQHFNAKIHCLRYNSNATFLEFQKLNIEVVKPSFTGSLPLGRRVATAIEAGNHFYNVELKEYDLINAQQTPSEWIRNKNKPVIWYCHTPNREAFDLYNWRMKKRGPFSKAIFWASIKAFKHFEFKTVPKIEYVFTNSINSQSRIKKYLNRESEVLYPGVEYEKFSCKSSDQFFFYPSRITPEKELEFAIEAFKLFSSRTKGWKLVISGSLSDRPEHQAYYKKIKSLCSSEIIIETNISEDRLHELYATCTAVLYTPVNEDFGLVPLEAMASSKPCIARSEGGPRETILNGIDGFLVDSAWAMAEKMEWLSKHPDKCASMGRMGRKKVQQDFTWDKFLKRFEQKANEVINSKT
ncbi:Trehalose synthase [Candidatus Bilamarchaeum dharawalense]|uniref:GDP-Man:Man(1)GlcNAc(2)-PP-Dol alpha-1,3-mannosyltransferase n=1 Tax=Candidatus Bilamarchaeum dharawalense TaxID=2885759 RepID=A0A5E4LRD2_9ARCH|nr:Trehalose synthase [Candidatus Bilamarchaeum dharawalense]